MIKQQAKVIDCDDKTVWLQTQRQSTCGGCQLKQGCGTGLLENHVGTRFSQISVPKTHDVSIGEEVRLAIPEEALLRGALLMYIFPLVMMFGSAAIAQLLNFNEAVEIFAGLSGLLISFVLVKKRLRHNNDDFKTIILEE